MRLSSTTATIVFPTGCCPDLYFYKQLSLPWQRLRGNWTFTDAMNMILADRKTRRFLFKGSDATATFRPNAVYSQMFLDANFSKHSQHVLLAIVYYPDHSSEEFNIDWRRSCSSFVCSSGSLAAIERGKWDDTPAEASIPQNMAYYAIVGTDMLRCSGMKRPLRNTDGNARRSVAFEMQTCHLRATREQTGKLFIWHPALFASSC